jgi:hypothetical protein
VCVWDAGSPNDASGILFRGRGRNGQQRGGAPGARGWVVWAVSAWCRAGTSVTPAGASEKKPTGRYGARAGERGRLQPAHCSAKFFPSLPERRYLPPCLRAGGTYSRMFGPLAPPARDTAQLTSLVTSQWHATDWCAVEQAPDQEGNGAGEGGKARYKSPEAIR